MSNLTIAQNGPANITIRGCSTLLVLRSGTIVPVATANTAGTVIVGGNLTIDANGVLSANTPNMSGYMTAMPPVTNGNLTLQTSATANTTIQGWQANGSQGANSTVNQIGFLQSGTAGINLAQWRYPTAGGSVNQAGLTTISSGGITSCSTTYDTSSNRTFFTRLSHSQSALSFFGNRYTSSDAQDATGCISLAFQSSASPLTGNSTVCLLNSIGNITGLIRQSQVSVIANATNTYIGVGTSTVAYLLWDDYSLLTRGYADGRYLTSANMSAYLTTANAAATYLPIANFTYGNLPDSPNLSLYLTTANAATTYQPIGTYLTPACLTYANLTGTPPIANATQLGSVKVGANLTIDANGVLSANASGGGGDVTQAGNNTFTGINTFGGNVTVNSTLAMNANLITSPKIQGYTESATVPTISGGNLTLNLASGNVFGPVALNAAISNMTFANLPASGTAASWTLLLKANGTAVSVTWPASVLWAAGSTPNITSTANKTDVFTFLTVDGGTSVIGFKAGQNY